jgi:hypothetical protein
MLRLRRAPTSATNRRPCDLSSKTSTYPFKETNAIAGIAISSSRPAMLTQKGYPVANRRISGGPSTTRCERVRRLRPWLWRRLERAGMVSSAVYPRRPGP